MQTRPTRYSNVVSVFENVPNHNQLSLNSVHEQNSKSTNDLNIPESIFEEESPHFKKFSPEELAASRIRIS